MRQRLLHLRRLFPIVALRTFPLPWSWKRWIIWYLTPRFGVGVHAIILSPQGLVLSLRSSYSRRWQLPGGGVQYHEELEQAMRREAREEIGVELRNLRMIALLTDGSGRGLHAVFRAEAGEGEIHLSEEHTEWRYLRLEQLPALYRRFVLSALAADSNTTVDAMDSINR